MNITLTVVVAAIVILITALVVITIFSGGMTNLGSIAEAKSLCRTQCEASCRSTGKIPITWGITNLRYNNQPDSCKGVFNQATPQCTNGVCTGLGD